MLVPLHMRPEKEQARWQRDRRRIQEMAVRTQARVDEGRFRRQQANMLPELLARIAEAKKKMVVVAAARPGALPDA